LIRAVSHIRPLEGFGGHPRDDPTFSFYGSTTPLLKKLSAEKGSYPFFFPEARHVKKGYEPFSIRNCATRSKKKAAARDRIRMVKHRQFVM
jgi:hypothetical protein